MLTMGNSVTFSMICHIITYQENYAGILRIYETERRGDGRRWQQVSLHCNWHDVGHVP